MRSLGLVLGVFAPVLLFVGPVLMAMELNMGILGILGAGCIGAGWGTFYVRSELRRS
jgi:hypothetical protein